MWQFYLANVAMYRACSFFAWLYFIYRFSQLCHIYDFIV